LRYYKEKGLQVEGVDIDNELNILQTPEVAEEQVPEDTRSF
jgi:hypothetical protein